MQVILPAATDNAPSRSPRPDSRTDSRPGVRNPPGGRPAVLARAAPASR